VDVISIGQDFEMPERQPADQDVLSVERTGDEQLWIRLGEQGLHVSEFNAARLVGHLSLFLGLRFIRRHARKLRL
jgi:hypothetical protein